MPIVDCIIEFFEEVVPFKRSPKDLVDGQIAWVPTLILRELPFVMDVRRRDARNHDEIAYNIRGMLVTDFRKKDRLPIHRINLQPTEELLVIKAKKRPCIMLSQIKIPELFKEKQGDLTGGKSHLLQQEQIYLPIYGVESDNSLSGFPPQFVRKVRQLIFPHLLYLPSTKQSKKKASFNNNFHEGIIRLDRIFSTIPHHAKISPTNIRISDEYLAIIIGCVKEFLLSEEAEDLKIVKELCQSGE